MGGPNLAPAERRPPIFGPEPWVDHAGARWSHWDRWYAIVCLEDFGGDWDRLADRLNGRSGRLRSGPDAEAKLSHLDDLTARLDAAGIEAATLTALEASDAKVMPRARRKVLDQGLGGRDYTEAMRDTPRRQLRRRALRGHWDAYPVDPAGPYEVLASMFEGRDHIAKSSSFARVREFEETLEELEDDGDAAGLLAVRRATLTAVAELAQRSDDSYGTIGDLGRQAWTAFVDTDWRELVEPSAYWRDVAELVSFDDYAHLHKCETLPWRRAPRDEVPTIAAILLDLADEYRAARLDWHAGEATIAVAWLHVAARRLDGFADIAERLGSDHWMPIVGLAEEATAARRPDLAEAVFDAADQPGRHRDYLRQRRQELVGDQTSQRPALRLITPTDDETSD